MKLIPLFFFASFSVLAFDQFIGHYQVLKETVTNEDQVTEVLHDALAFDITFEDGQYCFKTILAENGFNKRCYYQVLPPKDEGQIIVEENEKQFIYDYYHSNPARDLWQHLELTQNDLKLNFQSRMILYRDGNKSIRDYKLTLNKTLNKENL